MFTIEWRLLLECKIPIEWKGLSYKVVCYLFRHILYPLRYKSTKHILRASNGNIILVDYLLFQYLINVDDSLNNFNLIVLINSDCDKLNKQRAFSTIIVKY